MTCLSLSEAVKQNKHADTHFPIVRSILPVPFRGTHDVGFRVVESTACSRSNTLCQTYSPDARFVASSVEGVTCTCHCVTEGSDDRLCRISHDNNPAGDSVIWNKHKPVPIV